LAETQTKLHLYVDEKHFFAFDSIPIQLIEVGRSFKKTKTKTFQFSFLQSSGAQIRSLNSISVSSTLTLFFAACLSRLGQLKSRDLSTVKCRRGQVSKSTGKRASTATSSPRETVVSVRSEQGDRMGWRKKSPGMQPNAFSGKINASP
jgi:hypothetical protein